MVLLFAFLGGFHTSIQIEKKYISIFFILLCFLEFLIWQLIKRLWSLIWKQILCPLTSRMGFTRKIWNWFFSQCDMPFPPSYTKYINRVKIIIKINVKIIKEKKKMNNRNCHVNTIWRFYCLMIVNLAHYIYPHIICIRICICSFVLCTYLNTITLLWDAHRSPDDTMQSQQK